MEEHLHSCWLLWSVAHTDIHLFVSEELRCVLTARVTPRDRTARDARQARSVQYKQEAWRALRDVTRVNARSENAPLKRQFFKH